MDQDRLDAPPRSPDSTPRHLNPDVLVQALGDLQRGRQTQLLVIAMGAAAVEPLARLLLGAPDLHPDPRVLAAEALGAIGGPGAVSALSAAVCGSMSCATLSPALALSQEAVRNCAARELGRLGDRTATEALLTGLRRFHLVEAGRALLRFGEPRAIAPLVECLGDAFVRERMADVLRGFACEAIDALVAGLERRETSDHLEPPRSVERRATCARLLGELGDRRAAPVLRRGVSDPAPEVRIAAAIALARVAPDAAVHRRTRVLIEGLADRRSGDECAGALRVRPGPAVAALVQTVGAHARCNPDCTVVPAALRAIVRTLASMGARGVKALEALTRHPQALVRGLSLAHLCRVCGERAASYIDAASRDPDVRVRRTAAACARQLHRDGAPSGSAALARRLGARVRQVLRHA